MKLKSASILSGKAYLWVLLLPLLFLGRSVWLISAVNDTRDQVADNVVRINALIRLEKSVQNFEKIFTDYYYRNSPDSLRKKWGELYGDYRIRLDKINWGVRDVDTFYDFRFLIDKYVVEMNDLIRQYVQAGTNNIELDKAALVAKFSMDKRETIAEVKRATYHVRVDMSDLSTLLNKYWSEHHSLVLTSCLIFFMLGFLYIRHRQTSTELESTRSALNTSEGQHELLARFSSDMITRQDKKGIIRFASPAAERILGLSPEAIIGVQICDLVHSEDREIVVEAQQKLQKLHTTETVSYRIIHEGSRQIRWLETAIQPILNEESGVVENSVAVTRDITHRKSMEEALKKSHDQLEQRVKERTSELRSSNESLKSEIVQRENVEKELGKALDEKELLLREVYHRVKNNLQVVSSLLNLQSAEIQNQDTIEILQESQNRLNTMVLIHENLYRKDHLSEIDFRDYVGDLTQYLIRSHKIPRSGNIDFNIEFRNRLLDIDTAVPCGLIINELVSNALKYAFTDNDRPYSVKKDHMVNGSMNQISINFSECDKEDCYQLSVTDNGRGLPKNIDLEQLSTFGLKLVKLLVEQLDGRLTYQVDHGTAYSIKMPRSRYTERV